MIRIGTCNSQIKASQINQPSSLGWKPFQSKMEITTREPEIQRRLDEWGFPLKKFNWTAYNNSQTKEKILFIKLLADLCDTLGETTSYIKGRRPAQSKHMIFCMAMKIYSNTSARRLISELELCRKREWIRSTPHFNTVLNYFSSKALTHKLKYLIRISSLPLSQLEKTFSIDSSGVQSNKYLPRWSTVRNDYSKHRLYKKIHCIVGNMSNIIADVIVTPGEKADSPYFKELLESTAKNFSISEILADKGYLSRDNLQFADDLNIVPFIPFKKNSKSNSHGRGIWNKMFRYFKDNPEEFGKHYFSRNNVESTFFMIEQRFGKASMSKNDICQLNEILCKILCHNLCVLIQEIFLSGVEIDFNSCAESYVG